jgi:hypothetical protein
VGRGGEGTAAEEAAALLKAVLASKVGDLRHGAHLYKFFLLRGIFLELCHIFLYNSMRHVWTGMLPDNRISNPAARLTGHQRMEQLVMRIDPYTNVWKNLEPLPPGEMAQERRKLAPHGPAMASHRPCLALIGSNWLT